MLASGRGRWTVSQKPKLIKISQYSCHTYGIIVIFFIIILFMLKKKTNGHYAGIMLDAPTIALCPKLCLHNVSNASFRSGIFYATGS